VYRGEELLAKLFPQSHFYRSAMRETQRTSEVDLRSNLKEDLYVSLASYQDDGSATFVLMLNPLMNWMWIGGFTITIGVIIILIHATNKKRLELSASVDKKEEKSSARKRG
jgi:cytochrome c-type biogenesis protein CcmF